MTLWIAVSAETIGFVVTRIVDPERQIGEIYMLAVDPDARGGASP
jgi:ribosomal protein S18 acetylase RimI-like enzyme